MSIIPCLIGLALWAGATGLLVSDALAAGHITYQHALMPLLTGSTVAAAVYCHHRLMEWKLFAAGLFAVIAALGSSLTVYGTLGRVADARDVKLGDAMRDNRALETKLEELKTARAGAKVECVKIGPRCTQWQARVDALTKETAAMPTRALNPQADALVRLAKLLGASEAYVRELIDALDAPSLPLYLELASIAFFSAAFRHRRPVQVIASECKGEQALTVAACAFTQSQALADFRKMRRAGSQQLLASRWGVHEGTVSRWVQSWETSGHISRNRDGKAKPLALPAPARA